LLAIGSLDCKFLEAGDNDSLNAHDLSVKGLRVAENVANGRVNYLRRQGRRNQQATHESDKEKNTLHLPASGCWELADGNAMVKQLAN
jgi:hypothetical protein